MISVESILLADGPALSSEIARKLVAQGCSADVARQRISRAGPNVCRRKGLVFPRNVRFLYHAKHEGTEHYWTTLSRDIREASPTYVPALAALQARDGVARPNGERPLSTRSAPSPRRHRTCATDRCTNAGP